MDLSHIARVRAEYAAATEAWNTTWAAVEAAQKQHMLDGIYEPLRLARETHLPNIARFDAAFNAMAALPEDEEIAALFAELETTQGVML